MKAGLLAIAALSAVASAQPHRRHAQLHEQRDVVVETAYQTQVEYATVTAPAAVVYVDQNGQPISEAEATPAPAPVASSSSAPAPVVNNNVVRPAGDQEQHQKPSYTTTTSAAPQAPAYTPPSSPAPAPASYSAPATQSPPATGGNGLGITYSPYNTDNSCKSAGQVKTDIDAITGGYQVIRLYGTDCSQVQNVLAAAKPHGYKLFLGIFDITKVASEVATIASAVNGDWSSIDTVSVGNEGVNNNQYSVADVSAAVGTAKGALTAAGYTGPVVTVDTFVAIINNPALCNVGDYVAANCHAFFDGGVTAANAGEFVVGQAQRVSQACGGKKTVITESGWPSKGDANKDAVPGTAEQAAAIASLQKSFSSNLFLFSAFNDLWKQDSASTFGAEKYWGIYGNAPA